MPRQGCGPLAVIVHWRGCNVKISPLGRPHWGCPVIRVGTAAAMDYIPSADRRDEVLRALKQTKAPCAAASVE